MRKLWTIWTAICLAALFAVPMRAQVVSDLAPFHFDPASPEILVMEGDIDGRTPLLFRRALQRFPTVNTLSLNSGGGSVYAALPMAYDVHDARLKTVIPDGAGCASACSFLFFSGIERSADGQLGVHQIASGSNDLATGQVALGDIFKSFEDFGVPTAVISRMMNTPADRMYWFEPSEMAALGLIGRLAAPVEVIPDAIEDAPSAFAVDQTFEFLGGNMVQTIAQIRTAEWAGDFNSDCSGESRVLDDGGKLCSETTNGTVDAALTNKDLAGLSVVELGNGIYDFNWDLTKMFESERGNPATDMPPRQVLEAMLGDDVWMVHIKADRILESNGSVSSSRKVATLSIPMIDAFVPIDDRPAVFTALVRVSRDPVAPAQPPVAAPAPAEPSVAAAAPAPAPNQRVVTVMPSGGDYREISDAVAAAPSGARIEVYPGTYRQGVTVEKPLEIVGVGARDAIIWEVANDDVIDWRAQSGLIAGMTLRQKGTDDNDAWTAVKFGNSSAVVDKCDMTAEDAAVVMIYGSTAAPTLTGNAIHDGGESGVYLYDNAGATIEGNDIYGNTNSGIAIRSGADPVVRGNTIHDGKGGGVFSYEDGRGTIEDNEIYTNALAGMKIKSGADPVVRNNRIYGSAQGGVFVYEKGKGTVEGNDIYSNAYAGIEITSGADPVVRGNTVRDGKVSGIFVLDEGRGTIEDNDVFRNERPGIEIKSAADPLVQGNRVYENGAAGIFVRENGLGSILGNDIYANVLAGIEISEGSDPVVRGNKVRDGQQGGLLVRDNGLGTIEDNDIYANAYAGINIGSGANPVVRRNKVHDSKTGGIFIYENGLGQILENEIYANGYSGIEIKEESDPVVRDNVIRDGKQSGIYINEKGRGQITSNLIQNNAYEGIVVRTSGAPVVTGNTISGNRDGIRVYEGGMGEYVGNDLRGNRDVAFKEQDAGTITRRDNITSGTGPAPKAELDGAYVLPGLIVDVVTDVRRQEFGLAADAQGLVIVGVDDGSDAWTKGFRKGQVIEEAGQRKVNTTADLEAVVAETKTNGRTRLLLLLRVNGDPQFKVIDLDA